jgi:hypothetical protein
VALSWGEPVLPWWGRSNFVGRPWWGGWGGPRVINNVVFEHTVTNVTNIGYRNATLPNAVIAVRDTNFGHGPISHAIRIAPNRLNEVALVRGAHPVQPAPASMMATDGRAIAPPSSVLNRPAIELHQPRQQATEPWGREHRPTGAEPSITQDPVINRTAPPGREVGPRALFGTRPEQERERSELRPTERSEPRPALPPPGMEQRSGRPGAERIEREARPQMPPQQIPQQMPQQIPQQIPERRLQERLQQQRIPQQLPPQMPPATHSLPAPAPSPAPAMSAPPSIRAQQRQELRQELRRENQPAAPVPREALPGQPANRPGPRAIEQRPEPRPAPQPEQRATEKPIRGHEFRDRQ